MKRSSVLLICWFLISIAFNPMLTAAKEVELNLASWGPAKHYVAEARIAWVEEVNKALAGKVKIVDFPDGQLYGPKDVHKAVAKGQVDLGVVLQPRMLEMVPLAQGVYLPFVFESIDDAAKAYTGESLALIEKAMEKKRLKLVYVSYLDPVHIFSNKGRVKTINDFRGLRILSTSSIFSEIMAKLGAVPDTTIPQKEQYMALKHLASDSIATSVVGGYFQKMVVVAPYITKMNMAYPTILVCMNLKKWNKLPKEAQEVMRSIGQKHGEQTLAEAKGWEDRFTAALAQAGGIVTTLPSTERIKIKMIAMPVWEDWAIENGKEAQRLIELNLK